MKTKEFFSTRRICFLAIFIALSWVLYVFVKFPMPILFPSFLDFQISDLPALIAGFIFGPIDACIILFAKIALKLPMSSTAFVGELADLLIGLAFVLPSSLIYRLGTKNVEAKLDDSNGALQEAYRAKKSVKYAIIALTVGSLAATAVAIIANYFILVPFYVEFFFKGSWSPLVGMVSVLYPNATADTFYAYYLPLGILPFNLLRCLLSSVLTFFSYKHLRRAYKTLFVHENKNGV